MEPLVVSNADVAWLRPFLLDDILPLWFRHAVTDEGLFLPQLDRQWRRKPDAFGSIVSQARLLYNFAVGYRLTGRTEYRDAVAAGARFLLDGFRDREHGGWFHAVAPGGRVVEDRKDAYDHAFLVFGLSHAFLATREEAFLAGAVEAWNVIRERFTDRHGGLIRRMTRTFQPEETRRSQNPVMHLFEALLALGDVEPGYYADARRIGEFVLGRLLPGNAPLCLPEFYSPDWTPLPVGQGGYASIGHQFEWAYLLSAAAERGLPADWIEPARRLLDFAARFGLAPSTGGAIGAVAYDGRPVSVELGWWEQCEAVRALWRHATRHGRADLGRPLRRLLRFVRERFVDTRYGGWFSDIGSPPTDSSPDKGSPWKADYHVVGMCVEAL